MTRDTVTWASGTWYWLVTGVLRTWRPSDLGAWNGGLVTRDLVTSGSEMGLFVTRRGRCWGTRFSQEIGDLGARWSGDQGPGDLRVWSGDQGLLTKG